MAFLTAFLILIGSLLNPALVGHGLHVSGHVHVMDGGGMPGGTPAPACDGGGMPGGTCGG